MSVDKQTERILRALCLAIAKYPLPTMLDSLDTSLCKEDLELLAAKISCQGIADETRADCKKQLFNLTVALMQRVRQKQE
jgi:hypothetical protein